MIILGIKLVHGISPSGRNDILELCNSLGQAGSVEMTGEREEIKQIICYEKKCSIKKKKLSL